MEVCIHSPDDEGRERPVAASAPDSAEPAPRRRRRGGRGRRRPAASAAEVAPDAGEPPAEPAPAAERPRAPGRQRSPAPPRHRAPRPPRAEPAPAPEPPPAPAPAASPAAVAAEDDFGFEPDLPAEAVAPRATSRPDVAGADVSGAEAAGGEPRRRRRRRGGRGRRRSRPEGGLPEGAAPAPLPRVEPDDFGELPEEPFAPEPDRGQERRDEPRDGVPGAEDRPQDDGRGRREQPFPPAPRPRAEAAPRPGGAHDWFSPERLDACQRAIHYHFRDVSLLENALTHSSIKSHDRPSYERMEFLGDSVIGLVIAEYLYNLLPDFNEGDLTKVKSMVVSTDGLADAAKACGLDRFLAVGRGILMKDSVPRSLIADVFEGVVGAVYLDRGYETVRLYILDMLRPFIENALSDRGPSNYKSVLQQVAQRDLGETPYYEVLREGGPEHSRVFEVLAVVGRRRFPAARAATKKEAEQSAAKLALQSILSEKHSKGRGGGSSRRRRR